MVARRRPDRDRPDRRARRPRRRHDGHRGHDREASDGHLVEFVDVFLRVVQVVHDDGRELGERVGNVRHDPDHGRGVERGPDGHLRRVVMGALVPSSTLWYTARGTGFVAVVMLTVSVVLGILTTMRWSAPRWPRFVTAGLHKNISLLAVVFLGIHVATTLLDPVSPVHLLNAIVPFTGGYRPLGIGLGVVAIDLLAALVITSLLRARIGYRVWRAVHWSAYACWPVAMLHGLSSGTDAATTWARAVYISCAALVLAGVGWRVSASILSPSSASTHRITIRGVTR
jgi:sulfoxide reductase heme-binding subunit YedZ